jgi:hypothetical protein
MRLADANASTISSTRHICLRFHGYGPREARNARSFAATVQPSRRLDLKLKDTSARQASRLLGRLEHIDSSINGGTS